MIAALTMRSDSISAPRPAHPGGAARPFFSWNESARSAVCRSRGVAHRPRRIDRPRTKGLHDGPWITNATTVVVRAVRGALPLDERRLHEVRGVGAGCGGPRFGRRRCERHRPRPVEPYRGDRPRELEL